MKNKLKRRALAEGVDKNTAYHEKGMPYFYDILFLIYGIPSGAYLLCFCIHKAVQAEREENSEFSVPFSVGKQPVISVAQAFIYYFSRHIMKSKTVLQE